MKEILYDWFGLNSYLFHLINNNFGTEQYTFLVDLLDDLGGYYDIHNTILASLVITGISLFLSKNDTNKFKTRSRLWLKFYIAVFASEFIGLGIIYTMKHYFSYPRPFCADLPFEVNVSEKVKDLVPCMKSFPSGHTAFSSILVTCVWPLLNRIGKFLGISFVSLVMISRPAAGVHFPADLFWSLIICVTVAYLIRNIVRSFLEKTIYQNIRFFNLNY